MAKFSQTNSRAGIYVTQPTGYRAFIPAPLPPDPPVKVEGEIQFLLSRADRALGRLDGSIQTLPNPDLFVAMYIRKEAVLSSQIEGTQSSLQDVLAAEAKVMSPDLPRDVDEVFNYIRAMKYGLGRLATLPLSVRLIREIHAKLVAGVRGQHLTPGELRASQNWIGPAGCTLEEATFVPPPPTQILESLGQLENFIHADSNIPLLIKVGMIHAQFETIHPFLDGNGRIGRLLITFLLCQREVLLKPVLYLSYFFKEHRSDYYALLQAVRDDGDWESWLAFFLRGIFQVSQEATDTARRILEMRENFRNYITTELGRAAANGHTLLEHLFESPIITVHDVEKLTDSSYATANNLIARFVEFGILGEITGQRRNRVYRFTDYISLFRDEKS